MKRNSLISALVLLLILVGVPSVEAKSGSIASCSAIKTIKIEKKGTTLSCLDGKSSVKLEAIVGPTLINVWGSWCPPCRKELPLLRQTFLSGKVKVIGIDIDEPSIKIGQDFAIEAGVSWPNLIDPDGKTKSAFGIGVPVTWFLNSKGVVTHRHIGAFSSIKQLNQEIAKYL